MEVHVTGRAYAGSVTIPPSKAINWTLIAHSIRVQLQPHLRNKGPSSAAVVLQLFLALGMR